MKFISKKRSLFASLSMVMLLGISSNAYSFEGGQLSQTTSVDLSPITRQLTVIQNIDTGNQDDLTELLRRTATTSSTIGQFIQSTGTPTDTPSDLATTGTRTAFGALRYLINAINTINSATPGSVNANLARIIELLGADGINTVLGQLSRALIGIDGLTTAMGNRNGSTVFLRFDGLGQSVTDARTSIETLLGNRNGSTVFLRFTDVLDAIAALGVATDGHNTDLTRLITEVRDTVVTTVDDKTTEIETLLGNRNGSTVFLRFTDVLNAITAIQTSTGANLTAIINAITASTTTITDKDDDNTQIIVNLLGNSGGSTISVTLTDIIKAITAIQTSTGANLTTIINAITGSTTSITEVVNEGDTKILEAITKVTGDVTTTNTTINEIDVDVKKIINFFGEPISSHGHDIGIFELFRRLFKVVGVFEGHSIVQLIGHPDHCHGKPRSVFEGIDAILKAIRLIPHHVPHHGGGTSHSPHTSTPTVIDLTTLEGITGEILEGTREIHAHVVKEDGQLSLLTKGMGEVLHSQRSFAEQMTRSLSLGGEIYGSLQRLEHGMAHLLKSKECDEQPKKHDHGTHAPVHTPVVLGGLDAGKLDGLTRQTAATHHEVTEMGKVVTRLTGEVVERVEKVQTQHSVVLGTFKKPTYTVANTLEVVHGGVKEIIGAFGNVVTIAHYDELQKENAELKRIVSVSHDRMGILERQIALHDGKLDRLIALLSGGASGTHHGTGHEQCGNKI